jgi:hypothetical protein
LFLWREFIKWPSHATLTDVAEVTTHVFEVFVVDMVSVILCPDGIVMVEELSNKNIRRADLLFPAKSWHVNITW